MRVPRLPPPLVPLSTFRHQQPNEEGLGAEALYLAKDLEEDEVAQGLVGEVAVPLAKGPSAPGYI